MVIPPAGRLRLLRHSGTVEVWAEASADKVASVLREMEGERERETEDGCFC